MAKEIIMPKFGFTQEESEIMEWLHSEGDKVEKGDPIAVVSTDKISMEVEAPGDGILSGIRYQIGEIVPVTEVIAYILQPGESIPEETKTEKKKVTVPVEIDKKQKITATPLAKKIINENSLDIQTIIGTGEKGKITRMDVETFIARKGREVKGKIRATPAARRIGRERNINLTEIPGTGPENRIQAADVNSYSQTPSEYQMGELTIRERIPLIGIRRTIAQNMSKSWAEAPHMALQIDIPVDAMESIREDLNGNINDKNAKISLTAFITKAVASTLEKNPIVNSRFTEKEIIIVREINIGIATAIENGLIVPVIHQANQKSVHQISTEIRDLAQKARESKLQPSDLSDATFTISNLGMYDIDRFAAIINPPQAAILAVGKKNRCFVPSEENLPIVKSIVVFTLSADHRVMDGVQAAKFLADLKELVNKPEELLL